MNRRYNFIFCLFSLIQFSNEVTFERSIEAIGDPYYKISLRLGHCQENLLFFEKKAWPVARMNRILDIYYKSDNNHVTVSSVEIKLVINNTDCVGISERGVGYPEFAAILFFSTNMAVIFYNLQIYTCSQAFDKDYIVENDSSHDLSTSPEEENEEED